MAAVSLLAELISRCAHLRAESLDGDAEAWAETATALGNGVPRDGAVEAALAAHARRVG